MHKLTIARAPNLYLLAGIVAGLLLSQLGNPPPLKLLTIATPCALLAVLSLWQPQRHYWLPSFFAAAALCSWAYAELRLPQAPSQPERELPARECTLTIRIQRIFNNTPQQRASGIAKIHSAPNHLSHLVSRRVYFQLYPQNDSLKIQRGQHIQTRAVLQTISPNTTTNHDFDHYLSRIGIYHSLTRNTTLHLIRDATPYRQFTDRSFTKFQQILQLGAPANSELSNIYQAMLLGHKRALTSEQKLRFISSGTMHFFAISGLHIGVIATALAQTLGLIRIPRNLRPIIGLPLLFLYVDITGASPSAVRAFLMACFFWLSLTCRRQPGPLAALANSAIFVLIIDPLQLWSIGFQLSYAVVYSILLFGLPLDQWLAEHTRLFRWLPYSSWTWRHRTLQDIQRAFSLSLSISIAAWLASAPLSIAHFGYLSPASILLNLLLVSLASLVICSGVLALGLGLLSLTALAAWINHAAWLGISLMDTLVRAFTELPFITRHQDNFPHSLCYSALLALLISIWSIQHLRHPIRLTLPPAILLSILSLGFLQP